MKVLEQLKASGYLPEYFDAYYFDGDTKLYGKVKLGIVAKLKLDDRFACGPFHLLHADVGDPRVEFRSHTGKLGKGSLQIVINTETGTCYADIDRFSPYADLVGVFGHLFGEVVPGMFRRKSVDANYATIYAENTTAMNPLLQQMLMSLLRSALMTLAGVLIARGVWTAEEAESYIAELVPVLLPVLMAIGIAVWGCVRAYFKQKMLVTAQAMPAGVTTAEVKTVAKSVYAPPATLERHEAPLPVIPEPPSAA